MILNENCIQITNTCYHLNLNKRIDLKKLYDDCDEIFKHKVYKKEIFSGLRCKLNNISLLIFHNGKINMIGVKSEYELNECLLNLYEYFDCKDSGDKSLSLYNICTSYDLKTKINLLDLAKKFPLNSSYEPELFAGLIFTLNSRKFTIHRTGIIFSTGYKTLSDVYLSYKSLFNTINLLID